MDIIVLRCNINCHDVVFFHHPRGGLHFGEQHPILSDSHGSAGSLKRSFPAFGWTSRTDWRRVERLLLMLLLGVLSIGEHDLQLKDPQLNLDENGLPCVARMCGVHFVRCSLGSPNLLLLSIFRHECSRRYERRVNYPDLLLQARPVRALRSIGVFPSGLSDDSGISACCRSSV